MGAHFARWNTVREHAVNLVKSAALELWYEELGPDRRQCTQTAKYEPDFAF